MRRSHTSRALALIATTALLAGCSLNPFAGDTASIKNPTAVAPVEKIELLKTGTPTEQVKAYTDKAKEAQAKLQLLLEEQKKKESGQKSSAIINLLVPTALAQSDENVATDTTATTNSTADEIAALIEEIQTYTELAIEAADDVTDPTTAAALLDEVQATQATTADIVTSASTEASADVAATLSNAVQTVTDSIASVDAVAAEVDTAVDTGATAITVDVPTDVEDFVATNEPIILAKKRNPQFVAELKLGRAARELERMRKNLLDDGVAPEEVQKVIAEQQTTIDQAKQLAQKGDFKGALNQVRDGFQEIRQTEMVADRINDAQSRYDTLKKAAEAGDELAKEQLDKLTPLLKDGTDLTQRVEERQKFHEEFQKEAANMRQEFRAERQELQGEFLSAKRAEAAGEITSEEFAAKKQELVEARAGLVEKRIEAEKGLQAERAEKFAELKNLPPEEKAKKIEELKKGFEERKDALRNLPLTQPAGATEQSQNTQPDQKKEEIRNDKQELRNDRDALRETRQEGRRQRAEDLGKLGEAMQSGDATEIETAKKELKANRMENKTERQELKGEIKDDTQEVRGDRKELKEGQANAESGAMMGRPMKQPLPPTQKSEGTQDAVRDLKQDIKASRQDIREGKQEMRDNQQNLKEAVRAGDQNAVKEVKQDIRDDRAEFKEERKENRQEIREDKKEIREERQSTPNTGAIEQPKKPEAGQTPAGERVGPGPQGGGQGPR